VESQGHHQTLRRAPPRLRPPVPARLTRQPPADRFSSRLRKSIAYATKRQMSLTCTGSASCALAYVPVPLLPEGLSKTRRRRAVVTGAQPRGASREGRAASPGKTWVSGFAAAPGGARRSRARRSPGAPSATSSRRRCSRISPPRGSGSSSAPCGPSARAAPQRDTHAIRRAARPGADAGVPAARRRVAPQRSPEHVADGCHTGVCGSDVRRVTGSLLNAAWSDPRPGGRRARTRRAPGVSGVQRPGRRGVRGPVGGLRQWSPTTESAS
jgi:hypothetical protein